MTSTREAARVYADLGWSLLVLAPGEKKPLAGRPWTRAQRERADLDEVLRLLEAHPGAGLGLVTGSVSGVALVDVDDPAAVLPVKIPEGPVVESATPGHRHLYFDAPRPVPTVTNLFNMKVELRGEGAMTVLPPTVIGREYRWHGDPAKGLPPLPLEIIQAAKAAAKRMPMATVLRGVLRGQRNIAAARVAGFLLHRSANREEAWAAVVAWNGRNLPPLESGELRKVFESILRLSRRWRRPGPTGREALEAWVIKLVAREGTAAVWRLHRAVGGALARHELEQVLRVLAQSGRLQLARLGRRGAAVYRVAPVTVPSPDAPQREAPGPSRITTPVTSSTVHTLGTRNDKAKPGSNHSTQVHSKGGVASGTLRAPQGLTWFSEPVPGGRPIETAWERLPNGQLRVWERNGDGVPCVVGWSVPERAEVVVG